MKRIMRMSQTILVAIAVTAAGCGDVIENNPDANGGADASETSDGAATPEDAQPLPNDAAVSTDDAQTADADPNACDVEGAPCGLMTQCGEPGECTGFSGTCGETGSQTRTCVDFTCQSGACVASAPYDDVVACTRDTDGIACGDTTSCGSCQQDPGDDCVESGTRTCTTTHRECSAGSCVGMSSSQSTQSCSINTDGDLCGVTLNGCQNFETRPVCCSAGSCTDPCGSCQP